jgi:hypothetical protein
MAKRKQPKTDAGGPYLAAAFFCETTIEDKQHGTVSAIRLVDQLVFTLDRSAPPDFPSETQRLPVTIKGLLSFKTGNSPGNHKVRIVMESPSGKMNPAFEQDLPFSPEPHGGANVRLNHTIMVKAGGLFWFHIFLDGKEVTRMPLQISVQREQPASPPRSPGGEPQGNVQPPESMCRGE